MEKEFHVVSDAKDSGSVHQTETTYGEVPESTEELPERVDDVPDVFDSVAKKLEIKSIGWKVINTVGFLFVASILFFLVMLIVTS